MPITHIAPKSGNFIDYFAMRADYTYNHFRYGSFVKGVDDFSGKTVPSVPANTFSAIRRYTIEKWHLLQHYLLCCFKNISE